MKASVAVICLTLASGLMGALAPNEWAVAESARIIRAARSFGLKRKGEP